MNNTGFTEYSELKAVLLYKPSARIAAHPEPEKIKHNAPIDYRILSDEFDRIVELYRSLNVHVTMIAPPHNQEDPSNYNMMFCRDLFFMTPEGAVLAQMANDVRRGEVAHAAATLLKRSTPVVHEICGDGRFEGADALWVTPKLVAVGIGNRTNMPAFEQLQKVLKKTGVNAVALPSTQNHTQHLLGSLQIVDRDLALVRAGIISPEINGFLAKNGFKIIDVPENSEVCSRQAMNIVTISPRKIIMTTGCPATRKIYEDAGIEVVAEVEISQFINGAGGLACMTGILARSRS